jgi:EAL domain-containing protein (putative c-di-GMP-specific phosphodiesterase class I)
MTKLAQLPVSEIKIDRSFVGSISVSLESRKIVESTIGLAHSMGLQAIAEGVETEEALARLREYGCHLVQGYLIARPQPADALTRWLLAEPVGA